MELAGHRPRLAHPLEAKKRMGKTRKTDKLDAKGLAILLRNGSLPEVWIPPAELRDQRELLRNRMYLVSIRTQVKNRIHAILTRYNITVAAETAFSGIWREQLAECQKELPPFTQNSLQQQVKLLDQLEQQIEESETRLGQMLVNNADIDLLKTMPCVGPILSAVILLEVGDVGRFADASRLASYAGLVPCVQSSGGRTRMGRIAGDVNRTLKWAFVEAGHLVAMEQRHLQGTHVLELYRRLKSKKNHQRAVCAVARHLAEATYWILSKQEPYRPPARKTQPVAEDLSSTVRVNASYS
jgi:transposase